MSEKGYYYGLGRRKGAVARVRLYPGQGPIVVNGRPFEELFPLEGLQRAIQEPLMVTSNLDRFNVTIKVNGGGNSGQAGAISLGIARALVEADASLRSALRGYGLLTRDSRVKERKKYGLIRARKAKQYTKR